MHEGDALIRSWGLVCVCWWHPPTWACDTLQWTSFTPTEHVPLDCASWARRHFRDAVSAVVYNSGVNSSCLPPCFGGPTSWACSHFSDVDLCPMQMLRNKHTFCIRVGLLTYATPLFYNKNKLFTIYLLGEIKKKGYTQTILSDTPRAYLLSRSDKSTLQYNTALNVSSRWWWDVKTGMTRSRRLKHWKVWFGQVGLVVLGAIERWRVQP